jgi:hypothetical protein
MITEMKKIARYASLPFISVAKTTTKLIAAEANKTKTFSAICFGVRFQGRLGFTVVVLIGPYPRCDLQLNQLED